LIILILFIQQPVFAGNKVEKMPPAPTEGIASNNLYYADSGHIVFVKSTDGILIDWLCSIQKNGTKLYLTGE